MKLIEAEVYWRKNDLTQAIARLNEVRADVALPALTNPGTAQGVFDRLLEERFATLWLEGHRVNDLVRFGLMSTMIGTSYNLKWPIGTGEARNNPSVGEPRSCPKVT
jgi:hypothetical protein